MAWYTCKVKFMAHFAPSSLSGYHNDARSLGYVRALQNEYLDYLLGQISGTDAEKTARRQAILDFGRSPDCVFVLPNQPGEPDGYPSIDELRQRVNNAIAVYNTVNPDLNFATTALGDPVCVRYEIIDGVLVIIYNYGLSAVDSSGNPTTLPPAPARSANWQVGIEIRETL